MAHAYSPDLRHRVLRFVERGGSRREAARHFEVSPSFVVKLVARVRKTGSPAPGVRGGSRGKLWRYRDFLLACVEARPDITMPELAAALKGEGLCVAPASLSRFLRRTGFRFKKTLMASEQEREDVKRKRRAWIARRQPRMQRQPERLVFIDETGTTTKMTRLRGRAIRGKRLKARAPFGH